MKIRFGAAELYGHDVSTLDAQDIRKLSSAKNKDMPCPFKTSAGSTGRQARCNKKGGVCSLRSYKKDPAGTVTDHGPPVTTCPNRFLEQNLVFQWVGETLLGTKTPLILSELPFLMASEDAAEEDADAVGKIDKILLNPADTHHLNWCALEMQAVYFSGKSMENDFKEMRSWTGPGVPFPPAQRRPDFRSSGPKRLMPQLQIKVPTISRWGKKMAVVVDKPFWESLGEMREVRDPSNSDIAWFVVTYEKATSGQFALTPHQVHYTTLSHAVEGLTGGTPMSLGNFEKQLRARTKRSSTS